MNARFRALTDWLEHQLAGPHPATDILEHAPDLTLLEAYRIQHALIERGMARGDRIIGYKAAFTNKAMQTMFGLGEPLVGTLLGSRLLSETTPVHLRGFLKTILEPEVGVLLRADLSGPGSHGWMPWQLSRATCLASRWQISAAGQRHSVCNRRSPAILSTPGTCSADH